MRIGGLQKLTIQDFPGKVACIVFTEGCNFRCPFCHNGDLVLGAAALSYGPAAMDAEQVVAFLRKRAGLLDGVCVSGGEPLLQPGLEDFLCGVKDLGYAVKLDTNGSFPERLRSLAQAGLVDYVAMDIKNAPERYAETVGLPALDLAPIRESADFLLRGQIPYEFRTTVVKEYHTLEDLQGIARWIQGAELYFLQGFQDGDEVLQKGLHGYSQAELAEFARILRETLPTVKARGV